MCHITYCGEVCTVCSTHLLWRRSFFSRAECIQMRPQRTADRAAAAGDAGSSRDAEGESSPFSLTTHNETARLSFGKAPVWGDPAASAPPTSCGAPVAAGVRTVVEVKAALWGIPSLLITLAADARVHHLLAQICSRLGVSSKDSAALTLLSAGSISPCVPHPPAPPPPPPLAQSVCSRVQVGC